MTNFTFQHSEKALNPIDHASVAEFKVNDSTTHLKDRASDQPKTPVGRNIPSQRVSCDREPGPQGKRDYLTNIVNSYHMLND